MTPQELRETGINSLSPAQRQAFDAWLNRFTGRILRVSAEKTGGRYSGVGGGHWIKEVASGGAYVTLEDGSLWEIAAIDRIDTSLWLSITNMTVLVDKNPIGEFRYILVNKDDGEEAHARYRGTE
jgi:hypothetical protein